MPDYNVSKKPKPDTPYTVLSFDNAFTFGGSIISLDHLYHGIDKNIIKPVIVSGQPLQYLKENFPGCICYSYVPKLMWVNNKIFTKFKNSRPFRNSGLLSKLLIIARNFYWLIFIHLPEAAYYCRLAIKHNVVLFHFNNGHIHLPWILSAKILNIPCISHMRGFAGHDRTTRFLARFINRYVAISKAVQEDLLHLGIPEERISLVHNAIRAEIFNDNIEYDYLKEEFNLAPDQLTYGIFGRVVPWKGIREFLYAAKIADEEFPDARGFIVGDASDGNEHFYEEMKSLCVDLGLTDKIIFTGYRKDVSGLMALMDVIVHASIKPEPFGRVIIEGMAMRKPVIAARAGGPLDIVVNGQTGFLIDMQDSAALGNALRELLRDDTLRQSMGHNGQLRVKQLFDNDLYAKKMQDIFQRTRKW